MGYVKRYFVYIINNTDSGLLRGYVANHAGVTENANNARRFTHEQADAYVKDRQYRINEDDYYSIVRCHRQPRVK
jgi:hypothetical protein